MPLVRASYAVDYSYLIGKVVFSWNDGVPEPSLSGSFSVFGILPIKGARTIRLTQTGGGVNATAYKSDGTSKTVNIGAVEDIQDYDRIEFSFAHSTTFGSNGAVTVADID